MAPLSAFTLLFLTGLAAARVCTNVTIPIDISARQGLFQNVPSEGNLDTGAFVQAFNQRGRNYSQTLLEGFQTVTGSYRISAKFCHPDGGAGSTVQLLSHGIGFDKTYWDLPYNNYNYSYVETAIAQGYSTLAIDRFGIGNSSHGDPINTVQAQAEVEALNAVTTKLRNGEIPGVSSRFNKVIHVGHSFGSVQSVWLSALYPNNTDGLVLTGYSPDGSFLPITLAAWNLHSARLNQPLRLGDQRPAGIFNRFAQYASGPALINGISSVLHVFGITLTSQDTWNEVATTEVGDLIASWNQTVTPYNYSSGYLVTSDLTATQYVFLLAGFYDIGLGVFSEQTKQPVTIGEILTIGNAPATSSFTGPVLVFTGREDVPFCGGDCLAVTGNSAPSIPGETKMQFPNNTGGFEAYIQPNTGHGIAAHYNATAGYMVILNWLGSHGLSA
ncbi:alpha/beta-hydrolase [Massarina eburnea CBS 473.64]|uniref:Alpha/beta-hydrolase n=1 Tax=Massarina eburnea CBS 473.64 TaxID=1395130 RepID=A0A6A6S2G5_9PLEO|nr:alpha/beta-hydrolase [Massarina eburnea CBS 473.64]